VTIQCLQAVPFPPYAGWKSLGIGVLVLLNVIFLINRRGNMSLRYRHRSYHAASVSLKAGYAKKEDAADERGWILLSNFV